MRYTIEVMRPGGVWVIAGSEAFSSSAQRYAEAYAAQNPETAWRVVDNDRGNRIIVVLHDPV